MLKVAVGHSADIDALDAVREVVDQCSRQLAGTMPQAAVVFASIELDHETMLRDLHARFPGLAVIGCSTDGELSSVMGFHESSLVITLLAGDGLEVTTAVARDVSLDPDARTAAATAEALAKCSHPPRCCITLPESLTTSGEAILRGLKSVLSTNCPVVGGLAGDQFHFVKTVQFHGKEILRDAVPLLLLGGSVLCSHGVASGWTPIGRSAEVTQATANKVEKIGDASALEFYRRYIGRNNSPTGEYPIAVFEPGRDSFYLRAPLHADPETGAVTFYGDVPLGATVQLTQTKSDDVVTACAASVRQAAAAYPGTTPLVALCISCAGRRHILGSRTVEEFTAVRSGLAKDVQIAGFYAYGEIGPTGPERPAQLHNETFVTLLLGEQ